MIHNLVHLLRPCLSIQKPAAYPKKTGGNLVQKPRAASFEHLIQSITSKVCYGEQQSITLKSRLGNATADDMMRNNVKWHRDLRRFDAQSSH